MEGRFPICERKRIIDRVGAGLFPIYFVSVTFPSFFLPPYFWVTRIILHSLAIS